MLQDTISADPDVVQAVDDLIENNTLDQIRRLSAHALKHPAGSHGRSGLERHVKRFMDDADSRGERIGVSGATLIELAVIEAEHRAGVRQGRPTKRRGQALLDNWHARRAHAAACHRALLNAQRQFDVARRAERAAEDAATRYQQGVTI